MPVGMQTKFALESSDANHEACPFLDENDERCASRFRLDALCEAFEVCCGGFHSCQTFHRLSREAIDQGSSAVDNFNDREHQAAEHSVELSLARRPIVLQRTGS